MTITGILALVAGISIGLLGFVWLLAWLLKKAEPSINREVQKSLKEPYVNPLWPDLSSQDQAKKAARGRRVPLLYGRRFIHSDGAVGLNGSIGSFHRISLCCDWRRSAVQLPNRSRERACSLPR